MAEKAILMVAVMLALEAIQEQSRLRCLTTRQYNDGMASLLLLLLFCELILAHLISYIRDVQDGQKKYLA